VISDFLTVIVLVISGFGSGMFVGMTSGTAGSFMIPCLTIFLGYSMHQVIGTNLIIDCIIGGVAGLIFLKNGNVDLRSVGPLACTGVIGAFIGSRFTSSAPESGLHILIGATLILLGANFIVNGIQSNINFIGNRFNFNWFKENKTLSFVVFGFVVGLISGFSGMGGGALFVIIFVFVLGYELHIAIGTSLIMMFFIAGSGAIGHVFDSGVIASAVMVAGGSAAVGAVSGSLFANRINENRLGRVIGVIILVFGIVIILNMFFKMFI